MVTVSGDYMWLGLGLCTCLLSYCWTDIGCCDTNDCVNGAVDPNVVNMT